MPKGKPAKGYRQDKFNNQNRFLAAYTIWGTDGKARDSAGVQQDRLYRWKQEPELLQKYAQARKDFGEQIEHKAYQLVLHMLTPETDEEGKIEYHAQARFYQTLVMFVLNGMFPEKYKDHKGAEQEAGDIMKSFREAIKTAGKEEKKENEDKLSFDLKDIMGK
jgi:hypothetical protein